MADEQKALLKRVATVLIVGAAVWFAIQGGEFSTLDLARQRQTRVSVNRSIDSLRRVVDSLKRYRDKLEHDPATQERVAREVFGMVRGDKELLYRFTDSVSRKDSLKR
ncbi:MAG TPA: hypothetical protein VGN65_09045 [Casimicrobiaceae bacterium]|jgi:cell division protein FtsB